MRRVLSLLIAIFAIFIGYVEYDSIRQAQVDQMQRAAQSIGHPFKIPATESLADPALVERALLETARSSRTNVFRTQVGYDAADAPVTIQYSLVTQPTQLYSAFPLSSGAYPSPTATPSSRQFLSTIKSTSPDQLGVIRLLGGGQRVEIRSLAELFQRLPTAGIYYVELVDGSDYEQFLATLNTRLNIDSRGAVASDSKAYSVNQALAGGDGSRGQAILLEIMAIAFSITIALLLVYRQLRNAKPAAVMFLHGLGPAEVWYRLSGRFVLLTYCLSSVAVLVGVMFIPGTTPAFQIGTAQRLGLSLLGLLISSFAISMIASRSSVSTALKNRKHTDGVFAVNIMVKVGVALFVIVFGAQLARDASAAATARSFLGDWHSTGRYGIFYPTNVGNDEAEYKAGLPGPAATEALKLYPLLSQQGALYVDASQYEDVALAQDMPADSYRSLTVNSNYLKEYPILDESGVPVVVDERSTDWVVLVPDLYRGQARAIQQYFQVSRTGSQTIESIADAEKAAFGASVPDAVKHQSVKIIWTRSHQKVFSFDVDVFRQDGNHIADPIVQVLTLANSAGIDRTNAFTGGPGTALKVRLLPAGAHATLESLGPDLKSMKLDDNLRYLVTMDDYVVGEIASLDAQIRRSLVLEACLLLVLALVAVQGVTVVFDRYGRRVVVRRLHGLGMVERYQEFFRLMLITWLLEGVISIGLVLTVAGQSTTLEGRTPGPDIGYGLLALALVVLSDLGVSAFALMQVERKRVVSTLKEEF